MKTSFYCLMFVTFLTGCMPLADVPEMEQKFVQYQPQFIEISKLICGLSDNTKKKLYSYQPGEYVDYAAADTASFRQIELLLADTGFESFGLEGPACSIYLTEWGVWFGGEGQAMYFAYQPQEKLPFIAEQHLSEKRDVKQRIYFTKALKHDWYIVYENEP